MKSKTVERAAVIEEGVSALVFSYAEKHEFFDGVAELDYDFLRILGFSQRVLRFPLAL
jgi:hypothetical protein